MNKLLLSISIILLCWTSAASQSVVVETQVDLQDFARDYIVDSVMVRGIDITGSVSSLAPLSGVRLVQGDLILQAVTMDLDMSPLASIREVEGNVYIRFNQSLTTTGSFAALTACRELRIDGNPMLREIGDFADLAACEELVIRGNENLEAIGEFGSLREIGEVEIRLVHLADCTACSLVALERVEGFFNVANFWSCPTMCVAPGLRSTGSYIVTSSVEVEQIMTRDTIEVDRQVQVGVMDALQSIPVFKCDTLTFINISSCKALRSVVFDGLAVVDDLILLRLPLLETAVFSDRTQVLGRLTISQLGSLTSISPLQGVGWTSVYFTSTHRLKSTAFLAGSDPPSMVYGVGSNDSLETIAHLPLPIHPLVTFGIADNHALTICNHPSLCDYLRAYGEVDTVPSYVAANGSGCSTVADILEGCVTSTQATTVTHSRRHPYPSPALDVLYLDDAWQGARYTIRALHGEPIVIGRYDGLIDTGDIATGVYLLTIADTHHTQTFKIMIL